MRGLALFMPFDDNELAAVQEARSGSRSVPAGAEVTNGSAPASEFYTLFSGWAARGRTLADGRTQISAILLPGAFIDPGFERGNGPDYWIEAVTPLVLCVFPAERLLRLIETHSTLSSSLLKLAREEEGIAFEHLTDVARRDSEERLAHFLMECFYRMEQRGETEGELCFFPLRQRHIADALGLSVEHVNRSLRRFREDGLASVQDRALTLLDRPALEALAGFDPGYLEPRPLF